MKKVSFKSHRIAPAGNFFRDICNVFLFIYELKSSNNEQTVNCIYRR